MAQLADHFPYAVHVVPLHAWKSISETGELLSKADRQARGIDLGRATSSQIDEALGFKNHIHFYLSRSEQPKDVFSASPILQSKLVSRNPPFPHVLLLVSVKSIPHSLRTVSCWNVGRSKPKVTGLKASGSNLKDDSPEAVVQHWRRFREEPRARHKGLFIEGLEVPVIPPSSYSAYEPIIRADAKELLVPSPFTIPADAIVWSLSRWDSKSLALLGESKWKRYSKSFEGYAMDNDIVAPDVREEIEKHFRGGPLPVLNYD